MEGLMEKILEVEVHDVPGAEHWKIRVLQVLRTTCAMPRPVTCYMKA